MASLESPSLISQLYYVRAIKTSHTLIWAFFAASIVAIPICASLDKYGSAIVLAGIVLVEVVVLIYNGWRCPLTGIAARYTEDRRANFDIYLPQFLARYNKPIFGVLYAVGVLFTFIRWEGWVG